MPECTEVDPTIACTMSLHLTVLVILSFASYSIPMQVNQLAHHPTTPRTGMLRPAGCTMSRRTEKEDNHSRQHV